MTARRMAVIVVSSMLVLLAGLTLLWSVVTTSTAQLSATTSGSAFFAAGTVELDQPDSSVALLFDADGLYPGRIVSSCVSVVYEGTVPADVRLHASRSGGTGLEDFVELRLSRSTAGSCPDGDGDGDGDGESEADGAAAPGSEVDEPLERGSPVFTGLLGDLWRAYPDYGGGLPLLDQAEQGDRLVLDATVEMVDDDAAQGLTTQFSIIIEARP